ncbi:Uncharacterised protein [Shigella sonnei]|nr:Uncharacterised protein [Shigella sonnei]CSS83080.1 Uncharacterised protein [Shigella sonnei]
MFLFTILLALNSPACHQHCAIRRHQFSEFDYLRFRYASNFRRPGRALRRIIALTSQILFKLRIPGSVFFKEHFIVFALCHQGMRNP